MPFFCFRKGNIMGLLSIFVRKKSVNSKYNDLKKEINLFLSEDHYISKKEFKRYLLSLPTYNELISQETGVVNNKERDDVKKYISKIENTFLDIRNNDYVARHLSEDKETLDNLLLSVDKHLVLDEEQRKVILHDEDYTLVIAGAGTGKTTTIAGKVKYLVDVCKVEPRKILIITFTNKAVHELKERINKKLLIDCPISTFHSCGYAILRKEQPEKLNIVQDSLLNESINCYLNKEVLSNPEILNKLIIFFSYFLDFDYNPKDYEDLKKTLINRNLTTMKATIDKSKQIEEMIKNKEKIRSTINSERVKSLEEVQIANFLYRNNIKYEYERPYEFRIKNSRKEYTPDFTIILKDKVIYLEHFGISEDGKNDSYTAEMLRRYISSIKDKINIHKKHNSKLIYTFSTYRDGRSLLDHLKDELIKAGVSLNPVADDTLYEVLVKNKDNNYFQKFTRLVTSFIGLFKENGYSEKDFKVLQSKTSNERNKVFLDIVERIYLFYQANLKRTNSIDFQDMINESKNLLENSKNIKDSIDFDYIFVDEYQDISMQRFNFTKALCDLTNAKIVAVGDDWQSIYRFSGARIELLTQFQETTGYAKILRINKTYRNSQQLIDIAGKFIHKNKWQSRKQLVSDKKISMPVAIFTYDYEKKTSRGVSNLLEQKAKCIDRILKVIIDRQSNPDASILLIGRYNFDIYKLGDTSYFTFDRVKKSLISLNYPNLNLHSLTSHSSKGLGFDDVVIINGNGGKYGFPSKIQDDPVMELVCPSDRSYNDAEERRLFYVALTRTKNRVYIVCSKDNPSEFVVELFEDNKNEKDSIYINEPISKGKKPNLLYNACPNCGFPLYLIKNKYYGQKLWTCSNDPEICDFITNDLKGGKTRIRKCPDCENGYLIIKSNKSKSSYFLGCTNYKENHKGCDHVEKLDNDVCDDI